MMSKMSDLQIELNNLIKAVDDAHDHPRKMFDQVVIDSVYIKEKNCGSADELLAKSNLADFILTHRELFGVEIENEA